MKRSAILLASLLFILLFSPIPGNAERNLFGDIKTYTKTAAEQGAGYEPVEEMGLQLFVVRIINFFLSLLGTILIVLIFYAGFLWMTAAGNEEQVEKAQK